MTDFVAADQLSDVFRHGDPVTLSTGMRGRIYYRRGGPHFYAQHASSTAPVMRGPHLRALTAAGVRFATGRLDLDPRFDDPTDAADYRLHAIVSSDRTGRERWAAWENPKVATTTPVAGRALLSTGIRNMATFDPAEPYVVTLATGRKADIMELGLAGVLVAVRATA